MLRLTRIREREDGAIAIIVAMLFFFGVMLALGALTVDVGNINADRRQLQNGADAVALAVAQQCVTDGTCDVVTASKIDNLRNLANANAADSHTAIRRVDGVPPSGTLTGTPAICGTATGLPACPTDWAANTSNLQECPKPTTDLPSTVTYVRVYTETEMANIAHDNILPYYFGAAVAGVSGANQQTCAQVGIGPMGSSTNALPIVMARCAYDTMLAANIDEPFPPMPPNPKASTTLTPVPLFPTKGGVPETEVEYKKYVMTIYSHISGGGHGPSKCTSTSTYTSPSGQYLPGGFGWTTTPDSKTCVRNFTSDTGTIPIGTGTDTPVGCRSLSGNSFNQFIGTTVHIPIMTGETADGKNYIISGFAGFYVAGYNASASDPKSNNGYKDNGAIHIPSLSGGDDGFWGWFTNEYVPVGSWGTSTDPTVPKVIGTIG